MGKIRCDKRINRSVEGGFGDGGRLGIIDSLISQSLLIL